MEGCGNALSRLIRHQDLTANHILESFTYANAAARTGATGFVPADVGRIAFQQDNYSYWRLTDDSPVTWVALQNNIVESYTYANTAARTGATGFVPGDVGKLAYQTDTAQYWRLTATTPAWLLVAPNKMETWIYATAIDRNAATGFIANDVGRIAYQTDTGQYFRVVSQSAGVPVWKDIAPFGTATFQTAAIQSPTASSTLSTGNMAGLGSAAWGSANITPVRSGKIVMMACGTISVSSGSGGAQIVMRYGPGAVGAAPSNGAAPAGTSVGGVGIIAAATLAAGKAIPFSLSGVITGLTLGTAYWLDLLVVPTTAGTAQVQTTELSAFELP